MGPNPLALRSHLEWPKNRRFKSDSPLDQHDQNPVHNLVSESHSFLNGVLRPMSRNLKNRARALLAYIPALNLVWDILKTLKGWLS